MHIEYAEKKPDDTPFKYVKRWQKARKDLLLRANDLLKIAQDKRTDPAKAAELKNRSMDLYEKALRMEKKGKKRQTNLEIRRDALEMEIAILLDKEKHRK